MTYAQGFIPSNDRWSVQACQWIGGHLRVGTEMTLKVKYRIMVYVTSTVAQFSASRAIELRNALLPTCITSAISAAWVAVKRFAVFLAQLMGHGASAGTRYSNNLFEIYVASFCRQLSPPDVAKLAAVTSLMTGLCVATLVVSLPIRGFVRSSAGMTLKTFTAQSSQNIKYSSSGFSVASGTLELHNVEISNTKQFHHLAGHLLLSPKVTVQLARFPLIFGHVVVEQYTVTKPQVRYRGPNGNLPSNIKAVVTAAKAYLETIPEASGETLEALVAELEPLTKLETAETFTIDVPGEVGGQPLAYGEATVHLLMLDTLAQSFAKYQSDGLKTTEELKITEVQKEGQMGDEDDGDMGTGDRHCGCAVM
eukprot:CAMPEP_0174357500 /NCGR_PEP_ID=MMETSP0811_2-20130205/36429_1 /TAXON_ID=73025 ORGANISM="Eutreptiella gymnastica-like, Strain CCMP1594" /NCGR_SAMPLE_ID=MMETSP0811_2 /ASSEMBLY_ACC=CAM_ASM_000667 /LENGTH=365 /DNA_ID=CAMNT_0015490385 /DNA_START=240 /DNA_END=1337 /DNA_ORIENTATION=+